MATRSLEQLDVAGSAWPALQALAAGAPNAMAIVPADRGAGERTLLALQVTTRSAIGALALSCAGIVADRAWLRILGAGGGHLHGSLVSWNAGAGCEVASPLLGAMLVAHDACGGFFALDGGLFERPGRVLYRRPATLAWEDLGATYSDFLEWAAHGDLAHFWEDERWPSWESDVAALPPDAAFVTMPPPWEQGARLADRRRDIVGMEKLWAVTRPG